LILSIQEEKKKRFKVSYMNFFILHFYILINTLHFLVVRKN